MDVYSSFVLFIEQEKHMANNYTIDEYMNYDLETHRYTLTPAGYSHYGHEDISNKFNGSAENIESEINSILADASMAVYTYIAERGSNVNPTVTTYVTTLPEYRRAIADAMAATVTGLLYNKDNPALRYIKPTEVIDLVPRARQILETSGVVFRGT